MVWPTDTDNKIEDFEPINLPGHQVKAAFSNTPMDYALNLNLSTELGCIRLTSIMATMGKSTYSVEIMRKMMEAGMNIAVLNMCFGTKEDHIEAIRMLKQAAAEFSESIGMTYPLAIAVRLAGRKIRTGKIADLYDGSVEIKDDEPIRITTDETYRERCSMMTIYVDYPGFAESIKKHDFVLLDNETIMLKVEIISSTTVSCKVIRGGILGSYKDVYVQNRVMINMPNFSDKDKSDIKMAVANHVDMIIVPFVHSSTMITELKNYLGKRAKRMSIISNIQTSEGYRQFQEILVVSSGILISRQELGSDMRAEKILIAQKSMIIQANMANIPIFITSHILASMRYSAIPLRAEMLDVANCILDGADGLMLCGETAVGAYPVETIANLSTICKEAEICSWTKKDFFGLIDKTVLPCNQTVGASLAAVLAAQRSLASLIVVLTSTGKSAEVVSQYKPTCPIIAVTRYLIVAKQLQLYRGVIPLTYDGAVEREWTFELDKRQTFAITWALDRGFIKVGSPIILVYGYRQGTGYTNTTRIIYATRSKTYEETE